MLVEPGVGPVEIVGDDVLERIGLIARAPYLQQDRVLLAMGVKRLKQGHPRVDGRSIDALDTVAGLEPRPIGGGALDDAAHHVGCLLYTSRRRIGVPLKSNVARMRFSI